MHLVSLGTRARQITAEKILLTIVGKQIKTPVWMTGNREQFALPLRSGLSKATAVWTNPLRCLTSCPWSSHVDKQEFFAALEIFYSCNHWFHQAELIKVMSRTVSSLQLLWSCQFWCKLYLTRLTLLAPRCVCDDIFDTRIMYLRPFQNVFLATWFQSEMKETPRQCKFVANTFFLPPQCQLEAPFHTTEEKCCPPTRIFSSFFFRGRGVCTIFCLFIF